MQFSKFIHKHARCRTNAQNAQFRIAQKLHGAAIYYAFIIRCFVNSC